MIKYDIDQLSIALSKEALATFFNSRQVDHKSNEKGGVLLGSLCENNTIRIEEAILSSGNDKGPCSFSMNHNQVTKVIRERYKQSRGKITYLGDWHTHPSRTAAPSSEDNATFNNNFCFSKLGQNFLIYIIVGNQEIDNDGVWIGIYSDNGVVLKIFDDLKIVV